VDGDPKIGQPPGTFMIGRRGSPPGQNNHRVILASAVSALGAADPFHAAVLSVVAFRARITSDQGIIFEDGWQSVDKVLHPGTLEFISSKPPLLSVLMAGPYWLLEKITGWTLADQPFAVVRTLLLLVNGLLFVIYLALFVRLVERYGGTEWGKLFAVACACFGTYVTTFAVTFSNHSIAAYSVVFALYPALAILRQRIAAMRQRGAFSASWYWFSVAGFFASFTACCELPALSFTAVLFFVSLCCAPWRTVLFYLPAAAIPIAAFLLTNYWAVGQWRPVYSEFGDPASQREFAWYQYEGSHWRNPAPGEIRRGIDFAKTQESRGQYALHLLVGHHGLFSLTPIWVLAVAGMLGLSAAMLRPKIAFGESTAATDVACQRKGLVFVGAMTLVVSVAVVAFYLIKSDNYGGWTSGLRWLIWLSPLWILCLLPVLDLLSVSRWGRGFCYLVLFFSVLSVSYPAWNPWRHPWIYRYMEALGWPGY
jgi:hypothetical protein